MTKALEGGKQNSPPDHEANTLNVDGGRCLRVTTVPGKPLAVLGTVLTNPDPMGCGACIDLTEVSNSVAITASSVLWVNPHPGGWFYIMASGNDAYLKGSGPKDVNDPVVAPTATTTVTTGYAYIARDGVLGGPFRIGDRKIGVIGGSAAGTLTFLHITPAANPK